MALQYAHSNGRNRSDSFTTAPLNEIAAKKIFNEAVLQWLTSDSKRKKRSSFSFDRKALNQLIKSCKEFSVLLDQHNKIHNRRLSASEILLDDQTHAEFFSSHLPGLLEELEALKARHNKSKNPEHTAHRHLLIMHMACMFKQITGTIPGRKSAVENNRSGDDFKTAYYGRYNHGAFAEVVSQVSKCFGYNDEASQISEFLRRYTERERGNMDDKIAWSLIDEEVALNCLSAPS